MDCNDVIDHISAAIDGEIDSALKSRFEEHICACPSCRNEFELEQLTKTFVRKHLRHRAVPAHVADEIDQIVARAVDPPRTARWAGFDAIRRRPVWAAAAVVVVAAGIFLLSRPAGPTRHLHTHPADGNVIHLTYNNFDEILTGSLVPQVSSPDPSIVKSFFTGKTNFDVAVPRLRDCTLIGGLYSEYHQGRLAHIVYRHNDCVIYLFQAPLKTVFEGNDLMISAEAKREIIETGWYMENIIPDCSVAAWIIDSTLCIAIADIPQEELLATLMDSE